MASESPIKVGGAYQEDEDFVPDPTDMVAQFNTSGLGAHQRIEEVSPIFEVDKVKTAAEIKAALDPDNDAVPASRVILPNLTDDNDVAREEILDAAEARLDKGVVIGGPTPAQREAELEGDEGVLAAVEQERSNVAANSTGNRDAGRHEGNVSSDAGRDDTSKVAGRAPRSETSTGSSDGGSDSGSGDDGGDEYDNTDYNDLRAEVKERNEDRDEADKIEPKSQSKEDLAQALREDDKKG